MKVEKICRGVLGYGLWVFSLSSLQNSCLEIFEIHIHAAMLDIETTEALYRENRALPTVQKLFLSHVSGLILCIMKYFYSFFITTTFYSV